MIPTSHLHPMFVHFPIALVVFGFLFDFASILFKKEACLSKCGYYLLLTGTLSAIAALLTGALFTSEMSGSAGAVKETHELFAWITVGVLTVTSIIRITLRLKQKENTKLKWFVFILYFIATITVSITGFFGGSLVYNYMIPL
ncbi:MAG: DUF2231 domain-containing protein [Bacteroidota bacterium]|nr:DUF2231 domain-containing protein [Bacteroidota bacterium]